MQQTLRIMRKRGAADVKGSGNELGEIMIYAFLEEKLKAYKLLSKIELSTDAAQYLSEADGIHFLCADGTGAAYNQMVFGASNIVGEIKDAIDQAFEIIKKVSDHEDDEVYMVEKTVLDRFYDEDDLTILKKYVVPKEGKNPSTRSPTVCSWNTTSVSFLQAAAMMNCWKTYRRSWNRMRRNTQRIYRRKSKTAGWKITHSTFTCFR